MADVTLSVVLPTIGRPTLARALKSCQRQTWAEGDEVLLVGDGPSAVAGILWQQFGMAGRYIETPRRFGSWGHGARNWIMDTRAASGTHIVALDDDDALTPNASKMIRAAVAEAPDRVHIFRFRVPSEKNRLVWAEPGKLVFGNVGTPCVVVPNDPEKLGRFTDRYGGDLDFALSTLAMHAEPPVWREEIICDVWPARLAS